MTEASSSQNESVQRMCELIAAMAVSLVDSPDRVRVESESLGTETVLRLYVASDDLGKLIGKHGRTARSLRTILSAAGSKLQHRLSLDVQTDD